MRKTVSDGIICFNCPFFLLDSDAEDPDLDALLADLCQLEEDTKAQLATSKSNNSEQQEVAKPIRYSPLTSPPPPIDSVGLI